MASGSKKLTLSPKRRAAVRKTATMREPGIDECIWLVERRSKVQLLLLDLYAFSTRGRPILEKNPTQRAVFTLLVGTAFSLWRAAFLTYGERGVEAMLDNADEFLKTLVRDNAINYPQERMTLSWYVGYCLNNACFRLDKALRLTPLPNKELRTEVVGFIESVAHEAEAVPNSDTKESWDMAFEAAAALFVRLRQFKNDN